MLNPRPELQVLTLLVFKGWKQWSGKALGHRAWREGQILLAKQNTGCSSLLLANFFFSPFTRLPSLSISLLYYSPS